MYNPYENKCYAILNICRILTLHHRYQPYKYIINVALKLQTVIYRTKAVTQHWLGGGPFFSKLLKNVPNIFDVQRLRLDLFVSLMCHWIVCWCVYVCLRGWGAFCHGALSHDPVCFVCNIFFADICFNDTTWFQTKMVVTVLLPLLLLTGGALAQDIGE